MWHVTLQIGIVRLVFCNVTHEGLLSSEMGTERVRKEPRYTDQQEGKQPLLQYYPIAM